MQEAVFNSTSRANSIITGQNLSVCLCVKYGQAAVEQLATRRRPTVQRLWDSFSPGYFPRDNNSHDHTPVVSPI